MATEGASAARATLPTLPRPGAGLALFDLDRTLLPGSSLPALGRALVAAGLLPRRRLATAALRQARFTRRGASDAEVDRLRERALGAVTGLDHGQVRALAGDVATGLAATVRPSARSIIELHRRAGDFLVVLSASPQELVDAVTVALGCHRGIGTRSEVANGLLTGRLDGPFCYGPGKLARLRDALASVDLGSAWAYADSASDIPLLRACGRPVAINPDRRLRAVATDEGWPIVQFP